MPPDLRQLRYFVAVAEERNFTRAAERLHLAQPPLSAAIRQLEEQLGVTLLHRTTRQVELTAAGRLLLDEARGLLEHADAVWEAVRAVERAPSGRLAIGVAPPARFGVAPRLLSALATRVPGVMLYPREDTTGALLHELRAGRLDLVVGFCAAPDPAVARETLHDAPAVVHLRDDHPLASRASVALGELAEETFVVAGGPDSPGYTAAVVARCREAGFAPATVVDPYPDLGLRAVHEGLGVVLYVRSAFPEEVAGSAFVPVEAPVTLPFELLWRPDNRSGALAATLNAARAVRDAEAWVVAAG